MKNLTYVLGTSGFGGIIFAILAGIRWAVTYPDPSQAVFGALIGIGWAIMSFGFAYCYERINRIRDKQRSQDEKWDSFIQGKKAEEELDEWRKTNKKTSKRKRKNKPKKKPK